MAIFRAFFDDSRSTTPKRMHAMAGYLSTVDAWKLFDNAWKDFLGRNRIPYLHMKELFAFRGLFQRFKDPEQLSALLKDAVSVIRNKSAGYSPLEFSAVVYEDHLARFNRVHGLSLQPYSLAVAGCQFQVADFCGLHDVEMFVDHFDGVGPLLRATEEYLEIYPRGKHAMEQVMVRPASKSAARHLSALQAADFAVWEIRRYFSHHYHRDKRFGAMRPRKSFEELYDLNAEIIYRNIRFDYAQLKDLWDRCNADVIADFRSLRAPRKR